MAESFNNYLTYNKYGKGDYKVIVPAAGSSIDNDIGIGSRLANTVIQLHSIYVTQEIDGNHINEPYAYASFITLSVYDYSINKSFSVANNVMVLPHSSFYVEKALTLTATQELRLTYTTTNTSTTSPTIHTICSSVEIS